MSDYIEIASTSSIESIGMHQVLAQRICSQMELHHESSSSRSAVHVLCTSMNNIENLVCTCDTFLSNTGSLGTMRAGFAMHPKCNAASTSRCQTCASDAS